MGKHVLINIQEHKNSQFFKSLHFDLIDVRSLSQKLYHALRQALRHALRHTLRHALRHALGHALSHELRHKPLRDVEILHDGVLFCEKSFDFFLLTPKFVLSLFQSRIARQLNKSHSYHLDVYKIVFLQLKCLNISEINDFRFCNIASPICYFTVAYWLVGKQSCHRHMDRSIHRQK